MSTTGLCVILYTCPCGTTISLSLGSGQIQSIFFHFIVRMHVTRYTGLWWYPPPCSLCVEALGHREYHFSSTVCLFVFLRCGLSLVWSMPARVDFCQQATQIHLSPSPHSRNEKYLSLCLAFKMCAMQTKLGSSFLTGKRLADWALYLSMSQPFPQNK